MKRLIAVILLLLILMNTVGCDKNGEESNEYNALNYPYMKAMWISQYDLVDIYTEGGRQRDIADFTMRICEVLENVCEIGVNTVIVQVRPFGDSFYPSEYYPMSSCVVGSYGANADYDAFEIILEQAHNRGLSVHAWVNPLRAMRRDEIKWVSCDYKIRQWYDLSLGDVVSDVSGRLYLNPAYEKVRSLICDGVSEILEKYNVDGIHIDDYFYPTTDEEFDEIAYLDYLNRGGELALGDFRREQINLLVRSMYNTVKNKNPGVLFGVSPSGVMKNNYDLLYADVAKWCSTDGYLDYICPQIYFGFEHSTCAFDRVCDEFDSMVKNSNVKLIIGMSLGKASSEYDQYAGEGKYEWRDNKDILRRSFMYTLGLKHCAGVSLFSYQYFYDPISGTENTSTDDERKSLIPVFQSKK